jgi:hypothetical protein
VSEDDELARVRADLKLYREKTKRDHHYHLAAIYFIQAYRDYDAGFIAEEMLPASPKQVLRAVHEFIDACIQYREPAPNAMRLWAEVEAEAAIRRASLQRRDGDEP